MNGTELFGTLASAVVALSLTLKNIKRLRLVNLLGALLFAAYGVLIHSWPVALLNSFIVAIDVYYLAKLVRTRDSFSFLAVDLHSSAYVHDFLAFHAKDIAVHLPGFTLDSLGKDAKGLFVLRDMVPASLLVYRKRESSLNQSAGASIDLLLDYAIPAYRDYASARYFFAAASRIISEGAPTSFFATASADVHKNYLGRMGFAPTGELRGGEAEYCLHCSP